jgi:hypothetical protein
MRSWDFFDTLLGRACGEPWRVFELIGGAEFKQLRQQAEQKSDKSYAGIYAQLKTMTGWSSEKVAELAEQELDWERRLAFPIRENVSQVAPGDYVITDTYLDAAQVRELADRVGVPAVQIIATYGGKHHGTVWRDLQKQRAAIVTHTGDNRHADFDQARRHQFQSVHYRGGELIGIEKTFVVSGHWDVAGLSRCVRLQNPYARPDPRAAAWNQQANYNIPFLLFCAAELRNYIGHQRRRKVFFLSRDTCLLQRVFQALYPDIPAETFYASRQTYTHPSAHFIEYAKRAAETPGALFVDLQGTGKSVNTFSTAQGVSLPYLYCAAPAKLQLYCPALYRLSYVGTELEVFNYDVQGRVIDVVNGQPVRDKVEYDVTLVEAGHAAVDCLLRSLFRAPQQADEKLTNMLFAKIRHHAPRGLLQQHQVYHPIVKPK